MRFVTLRSSVSASTQVRLCSSTVARNMGGAAGGVAPSS